MLSHYDYPKDGFSECAGCPADCKFEFESADGVLVVHGDMRNVEFIEDTEIVCAFCSNHPTKDGVYLVEFNFAMLRVEKNDHTYHKGSKVVHQIAKAIEEISGAKFVICSSVDLMVPEPDCYVQYMRDLKKKFRERF
ncbi:MAG: hypothetical protein IT410_03060 [Candidatus Doudnabacteria bacterium]|nr:hypothetical protein [Candidatus Doudnabacteria bacterium]